MDGPWYTSIGFPSSSTSNSLKSSVSIRFFWYFDGSSICLGMFICRISPGLNTSLDNQFLLTGPCHYDVAGFLKLPV